MKLTAQHDKGVNLLMISSAENCDTDSWPMVPQLQFRHYRGNLDTELGAVAAAILFSRHCGAVADFNGARISLDAARAIRCIMPEVEELFPIHGMKRDIGQGVSALVVGEAQRMFNGGGVGRVGRSARAVTWSGDFVGGDRRDSTEYVGGDIFTNATLIAGTTEISVALALLVGGKAIRDIYVPPPPKEEAKSFARIAAGLEFVSVKLQSW